MDVFILVGTIFVLMFLGVPIGVSLAMGILALLAHDPQLTPLEFVAQKMYAGLASFPLLALPFFMLSGSLMDSGGISSRLVRLANSLVGNITGGLGIVTILSCVFFGAISGSAPATVAAIGTMMIPQMVKAGYDKYYATSLIAVAGGLGVIVPPSYPFVIYGVVNNQSIGDLFLAGIGPAVVVTLILIAFNHYFSKKHGYLGSGEHFSWGRVVRTFWEAKWALLMPVIILGGIYSGVFTPTEAAVVATVYGVIIGTLVYRELRWKRVLGIYYYNASFFGGLMLTFAPAASLGPILAYLNIPSGISHFFAVLTSNGATVLVLIFIILLILGMFIQTNEAMIIISPVLLVVVSKYGIDPIHFGILMTLALAIAFVTPPVAVNLFVASSLTGIGVDRIAKGALPFIVGLTVAFFVIAFFPWLSIGLLH